jgi:hypothetical protein
VRAAVKAKVAGVANVGTVHDYERFANTPSALIADYVNNAQTGNRINGWFVSRAAYREVFIDTGRWVRDDDWRVVGYMGLDDADATEKKISTLVDAIADAFRNDDTLGGVVGTCIIDTQGKKAGLQLDELGHVLFAGVLCHRARCSLTTRSFI